MKHVFVCLIAACFSLSTGQELSPRIGDNDNGQHVTKLTSTRAILPISPSERPLALIVSVMFLAGLALACSEVASWWKARMTQDEPPPLANLVTYMRDSDKPGWRATQAEHLRNLFDTERKVRAE